ncbi:MAG: flagellar basal body rod protein FlgC [Calditrichia bacterium]
MPIDRMFSALNISSSGLSAQRRKLDAISSNIANAQTTRTEDGTPYQRKEVVMRSVKTESFDTMLRRSSERLHTSNPRHINGRREILKTRRDEAAVKAEIRTDPTDYRKVYDPNHPDADENGYVYLPNVNILSEMVDMLEASRSYEANLSAIDAEKKMAKAALDI